MARSSRFDLTSLARIARSLGDSGSSMGRLSCNGPRAMFRLVLGLDVNGHDRLVQGVLERGLQPVANGVRSRHRHVSGDDEMEVDEGRAAGVAGAHVMKFERVDRISR